MTFENSEFSLLSVLYRVVGPHGSDVAHRGDHGQYVRRGLVRPPFGPYFEYESNLIGAGKPVIGLWGANLYGARLVGANLVGARLVGANLEGANLVGARLGGAYLVEARLEGANLEGANLYRASLVGASLGAANVYGANLGEANLKAAFLLGANLEAAFLLGANLETAFLFGAYLLGTERLTQEQINMAHGDENTKLPDHLQRPEHWSKGDEEQPKEG